LAMADVGLAMNSGTQAAKEAANMVDLESNPAKIIEVVMLGKQLLMTRGAVTTFSIANDVAKYFAIMPVLFASTVPELKALNVLGLGLNTAVVSALIFNAIIIPLLIPLAMRGVTFKPSGTMTLFLKNTMIYGFGGVFFPSQANGSLVQFHGKNVGSSLIAQNFSLPIFFHPRNDSASGVDPDLTVQDAYSQIPRINSATGISANMLQQIVKQNEEGTF